MKENLHFKHSRLNYINHLQTNKKGHIRLVIVYIGVDVVFSTNDEIYILSFIKVFSFL